jgi:predicted dehydrogenase
LAHSPIRVGIVGAGANTRSRHIPGLRAVPGVEVVSVANRSRASSERTAAELNIPTVYDDWQTLVQAADTDAIVIGTWPYLHCEVTLAALNAGKHVLCEARMAMDLDEARRMLGASRSHPELVAQLVPSPMTLGVDNTIIRLLREGYLGDLLALEVQANGSSFLDRDSPLHWRQDRNMSGNNIMSMGIWFEAVQRWVGDPTRVFAQGKVSVSERTEAATGKLVSLSIPDHLHVLAELPAGAQAHCQFSAVTGLAPEPSAWLFGSAGTLQFRANEEALYGGRRGATTLERISIPESEHGGWRVEQEFIGAIRGEEKIKRTTFEDGVRYMEFTEAVRLSLDSGQAVDLPLP